MEHAWKWMCIMFQNPFSQTEVDEIHPLWFQQSYMKY